MAENGLKSYREIFKESLHLYSGRCLSLLGITLIFFIPTFFLFYRVHLNYSFGETVVTHTSQLVYQLIFILLSLVIWLFSYLSLAALIKYTAAAYHQKSASIQSSYKEAIESFLPFFIAHIIYSIRVLLWGLCLFFPGVYFGILYNYAPMIVLLEGVKPKEALNMSAVYIKPHLVKYLDYLLLTLVIAILACVPFIIVFDYLIEISVSNQWWRLSQIFDALEVVIFLMALQFMFVFYYVLFEELKKGEAARANHS